MSEDTQIAVVQAKPKKNIMAMFDKVKGLDENSPLRKLQGTGQLRLTVDSDQFQIKKGSKVIQTLSAPNENGKVRPVKSLDVVIHMVSSEIQKQAAVKWNPKDPKFEPLGCWSNDGDKPDEDVWNKQSHSCDTCKFGKGEDAKDSETGKMASCGLTRLAVVSILSGPDQDPNDVELMLMNFNWSSNSTKKKGQDPDENMYGMINYLNLLAGMEVETHRVITRLHVDDWSVNTPKNNCKILFEPVDTIGEGHPNFDAHMKWQADSNIDLEKLCQISQRKPADDAPEGDGGAPEAEPEKRSKKKAAAKKKATSKKKAAAKKTPEPEEEDDELEDLEDIVDDTEEELDDIESEELVEEDDDDFGSLEDLLDE